MSYRIVVDSGCDVTQEMKSDPRIVTAPLVLQVGDEHMIDDDTFNQKEYLKKVAACPTVAKTACPSPGAWNDLFDCDKDRIYAVTISSQLSGSYNSAQLGRNMMLEDEPDKKIYVFDAKTVSCGQALIVMKIQECEEAGMSFEETIAAVEKYIESQKTWFVLEDLETLRKNGRLSNLKAKVASVLSIKPVMTSTPEGSIEQLTQCRGMNKALIKMVENIAETKTSPEDKILGIAHCNCPDRAQMVADALRARMNLKGLFIVDTRGLSSTYANDGGIIIVV